MKTRARHLAISTVRTASAVLLAAALLPGFARAAGDVGGTVTTTDPAGAPVEGAFVAITGSAGQYTATTDALGQFSDLSSTARLCYATGGGTLACTKRSATRSTTRSRPSRSIGPTR